MTCRHYYCRNGIRLFCKGPYSTEKEISDAVEKDRDMSLRFNKIFPTQHHKLCGVLPEFLDQYRLLMKYIPTKCGLISP